MGVLTRCIRGAAPSALVQPKKVRRQIVKFAKKAKIWKTEPKRQCFGQDQEDPLPPGLPMCLCPEFHEQIRSTVCSFLATVFGRTAESGLLPPWRQALEVSRTKEMTEIETHPTKRYYVPHLQAGGQQKQRVGMKRTARNRKRRILKRKLSMIEGEGKERAQRSSAADEVL